MIGSDFVPRVYPRTIRCSECGTKIPKNTEALVSIQNGVVKKIVCSEDCRQEFDYRFWSTRRKERLLTKREKRLKCVQTATTKN